jgi:hypothetical protein
MRSAGNFHPEWGYLAPAPGFMRTVRIALVATAIGAVAGAVVVVSLVERPGANDDSSSIASHALVTSAPIVTAPVVAAAPVSKAVPANVAQAPVQAGVPAQAQQAQAQSAPATALASRPAPLAAANGSGASAGSLPVAAVPPSRVASASTVTSPVAESVPAAPVAASEEAAVPDDKKVPVKKRRAETYPARRWQSVDARKRWRHNSGFGPLLRLFSFRAGSSPFAN